MEVMARYGDAADVAWKVGRIMLKYRPIAPKPVAGGAVAAGPADGKAGGGRGKRKGAASGPKDGSRRGRKATKRSPPSFTASTPSPVVTLPLMPVTPERKEESPATPSPTASDGHAAASFFGKPTWQQRVGATTSGVLSWVAVECVTDAWRDGEGCSPAATEVDACPVFVSDASDRVTWTNDAYRRMVVGPEEGENGVRVALETRGMVPRGPEVTCFTCMVRVGYACRRKGKVSMAAPCDVWRLADGRLAWRLDVKAALCLSLGC